MATGKSIRLRRIMGKDGRALVVAMDQAAVAGPQGQKRDPAQVVQAVAKGLPDALLLTRGMLRHGCESVPRDMGIIMRVSGGFTVLEGAREFRDRIITGVEDALRWGVDGLAAAVKFGHELEGEFIQALSSLADACDRWEVPLLVEAMVALRGSAGLSEEEALAVAARAAAELGADLVMLKYPAKGGTLSDAIGGCPIPVLLIAGETLRDEEVLDLVRRAQDDGAAGAVLGRNAWQRERPDEFLSAVNVSMGRGK